MFYIQLDLTQIGALKDALNVVGANIAFDNKLFRYINIKVC